MEPFRKYKYVFDECKKTESQNGERSGFLCPYCGRLIAEKDGIPKPGLKINIKDMFLICPRCMGRVGRALI